MAVNHGTISILLPLLSSQLNFLPVRPSCNNRYYYIFQEWRAILATITYCNVQRPEPLSTPAAVISRLFPVSDPEICAADNRTAEKEDYSGISYRKQPPVRQEFGTRFR